MGTLRQYMLPLLISMTTLLGGAVHAELSQEEARHLLLRSGQPVRMERVEALTASTREAAVDALIASLEEAPAPQLPQWFNAPPLHLRRA